MDRQLALELVALEHELAVDGLELRVTLPLRLEQPRVGHREGGHLGQRVQEPKVERVEDAWTLQVVGDQDPDRLVLVEHGRCHRALWRDHAAARGGVGAQVVVATVAHVNHDRLAVRVQVRRLALERTAGDSTPGAHRDVVHLGAEPYRVVDHKAIGLRLVHVKRP